MESKTDQWKEEETEKEELVKANEAKIEEVHASYVDEINDLKSEIDELQAELDNQEDAEALAKENEELKWAMGISENTHDLTIAVGKAQTALSYTVALRDKLLEAYREIMQIQI